MKTVAPILCCLFITQAHADEVRLKVVGPDKKPIVGAQVRLVEAKGVMMWRRVEKPLDLTTDAEGQAALETKVSLEKQPQENAGLMQGSLNARISASGMAATLVVLKAGDNEIALQTGRSWGGVVLDQNQKPVAGVKVLLVGFEPEDLSPFATYAPELQAECISGADGRWSFDAVPPVGMAQVRIEDPRFARQIFSLSLAATTAPPLFLDPGVTLKGRLLTPEGQPAAGVALMPGGANESYRFLLDSFATEADGTFTLPGLNPGSIIVSSPPRPNEPSRPYIFSYRSVDGLKAGEVRDLGDIKAEAGVTVKGTIVSSATKEPLKGVNVLPYGAGAAEALSDATGAFTVVTGQSTEDMGLSLQGYVRLTKNLPDPVGGVIDLGTLELKPGLLASGTVKSQNGRSAGELMLYADDGQYNRVYARSDKEGQFKFTGLEPGEYTLKGDDIKIVGEVKFKLVAGQETAPLQVVVADADAAETPHLLRGHALDAKGQPVAGAKIAVLATNKIGVYQNSTLVSGVDGSFEGQFTIDQATAKIVSVTRPGYIFNRPVELKTEGDVWQTDLVLQPLGTFLRGRVIDAVDQPVPDAFVSLASESKRAVKADESGQFALPDAPAEGITLLASNGRGYGESKLEKAGGDVTVTLHENVAEPKTAAEAKALAERLLPQSMLNYVPVEEWDQLWNQIGGVEMGEIFLRAKRSDSAWSFIWIRYLKTMANREPERFAAQGDELLEHLPPENLELLTLLARTRAKSADPNLRAKAQQWLDVTAAKPLDMTAGSVANLLRTTSVAEALKPGGGTKWLDFAGQIAAQQSPQMLIRSARGWGGLATPMSAQAVEALTQEWPAEARFNFYQGVVITAAQQDDLKTVAEAIGQMEKIQPQIPPKVKVTEEDRYASSPAEALQQALSRYARLLSKTDPAATFEMLPQVEDYARPRLLVQIATTALKMGQTELAVKALRAVFEGTTSDKTAEAQASKTALQFDPKLGEELFQKAFDKLQPGTNFAYRITVGPYAQARAASAAGESRILIEREWGQCMAEKPKKIDFFGGERELTELISAMAFVAPGRAVEMLEKLNDKEGGRAEARGAIAWQLLQVK